MNSPFELFSHNFVNCLNGGRDETEAHNSLQAMFAATPFADPDSWRPLDPLPNLRAAAESNESESIEWSLDSSFDGATRVWC
jgi:hypothetical protein